MTLEEARYIQTQGIISLAINLKVQYPLDLATSYKHRIKIMEYYDKVDVHAMKLLTKINSFDTVEKVLDFDYVNTKWPTVTLR